MTIVIQACLPVLGLGIGAYLGTDVVVYPEAFRISGDRMDSVAFTIMKSIY